MIITAISDTHTKHREITKDLPGGDLLLCSGDISSMGYKQEIRNFLDWFEDQDYHKKVFIAGNHDWGFQDYPEEIRELVAEYDVEYLEDNLFLYHKDMDFYEPPYQERLKIWGSPWQPEFCNWAFNLPRMGQELELKWDEIPPDTDILLTHGPAWGHLDVPGSPHRKQNLGCELLAERIKKIKPKIHISGHIHGGYGYEFVDDTHYINASVLNERYMYTHRLLTIDWNEKTNEVKGFL